MSTHRQWDESRSPQWKYLLQKESAQKRKTRKDLEIERARKALEEGAPPKARIGKKKNKKRFVRNPKGNQKSYLNITNKLTQELYDTDTTTRLSTEPKEQE